MEGLNINLTVTHKLSPELSAFINHFLQLIETEGEDSNEAEAVATGGELKPVTQADIAEGIKEKTGKVRRTKAQIAEDNIKAAMAQSAAGPLATAPTVAPAAVYEAPAVADPLGFNNPPPPVAAAPVTSEDAINAMLFGTAVPAVSQVHAVVTMEQARELAGNKAREGKHVEVFNLLKEFGVTSVSEITDQAKISAFYVKVAAL